MYFGTLSNSSGRMYAQILLPYTFLHFGTLNVGLVGNMHSHDDGRVCVVVSMIPPASTTEGVQKPSSSNESLFFCSTGLAPAHTQTHPHSQLPHRSATVCVRSADAATAVRPRRCAGFVRRSESCAQFMEYREIVLEVYKFTIFNSLYHLFADLHRNMTRQMALGIW